MGIKLEKQDIPYELRALVDIVGLEKFQAISKHYGGTSIYIPVYRKILIGSRNRTIVESYNGKNMEQLGREYNITKRQVRNILYDANIIY